MIDVTKITVRSFNLDHLDIFWEIPQLAAPVSDSVPHPVFDYTFTILRSEAAMGPYEQIGGPLRDTYRFRDIQVSLLHRWRAFYYRIRVIHVPSGETKEFGPASHLGVEPDLAAAEVIRQEDMLFRNFIGRRSWLYPARTFGPRCSCFDKVRGTVTRANHGPCFGTGWLGGYMSPVEIWPQIDPSQKAVQLSAPNGKSQITNTAARATAFPPISPDDILIEAENIRWRVVTVVSTERLRATVRQELTLHQIPRGDIEYALPVNVDAATVVPAEERNFTNPQGLDDGNYSDILAAYGRGRGVLR